MFKDTLTVADLQQTGQEAVANYKKDLIQVISDMIEQDPGGFVTAQTILHKLKLGNI